MRIVWYFAGEGFLHFPLSMELRMAMREAKIVDEAWHLTKYGLRLAAQGTRYNSQPWGFQLIRLFKSGLEMEWNVIPVHQVHQYRRSVSLRYTITGSRTFPPPPDISPGLFPPEKNVNNFS